MDNTIEAHGLVRRFGDTTALDGVDLAARTGSVLAVLGPNGAGKTTAVRILATLLEPDEGRALVGGHDVVAQAQQVRRLIALPPDRLRAKVHEAIHLREGARRIQHGFAAAGGPSAAADAFETHLLHREPPQKLPSRQDQASSGGS